MDNHCVVPTRNPRNEIVYRPIDQLQPNPRNARRHSRKQVQQIANSIQAFGSNVPTGSGAGDGDLLPRGSMAPPGRLRRPHTIPSREALSGVPVSALHRDPNHPDEKDLCMSPDFPLPIGQISRPRPGEAP